MTHSGISHGGYTRDRSRNLGSQRFSLSAHQKIGTGNTNMTEEIAADVLRRHLHPSRLAHGEQACFPRNCSSDVSGPVSTAAGAGRRGFPGQTLGRRGVFLQAAGLGEGFAAGLLFQVQQ